MSHGVIEEMDSKMSLAGTVLAGIDLGTLSCRLLVVRILPDGQWEELYVDRKLLRLGEGVATHKKLSEPAMNRVLDTLTQWREALRQYQVDEVVCVATSAVRDSDNRGEFIERIESKTGLVVEVLSGQDEAAMSMDGMRSGLPTNIQDVLALDIGGGSTEFIRSVSDQRVQGYSVDIGVVRLTEMFFSEDPPSDSTIKKIREWIRSLVCPVKSRIGNVSQVEFVGTAGTVTTLAAMAQGLKMYERKKVQNYIIDMPTIRNFEEKFLVTSAAVRAGLPGLEPGREDVILSGTLILHEVMDLFGFSKCRVSDFGLREGILLKLAKQTEKARVKKSL